MVLFDCVLTPAHGHVYLLVTDVACNLRIYSMSNIAVVNFLFFKMEKYNSRYE